MSLDAYREDFRRKYDEGMVAAAYRTVDTLFTMQDEITEKDVPLEFIAILREGLNRAAADKDQISMADVPLPNPEQVPPFVPYMDATRTETGWLVEVSSSSVDVSISIPMEDVRAGSFIDDDIEFDDSLPDLPVSMLSDERLDEMNVAVRKAFDGS